MIALSFFLALRIPESLKFLLVNGKMKQFWHAMEIVKRYNKPSDEDMKRLKAQVESYRREERKQLKQKEAGNTG